MQGRTWFKITQKIGLASNQSRENNRWLYYLLKQVLDFAGSIVILTASIPLFILIAILIKLDSPGPVFFVQKRIGARRTVVNGKTVWQRRLFNCYKFRSMVFNADPSLHRAYIKALIDNNVQEMSRLNEDFKVKKLQRDPRVTRVGWYLRRLSLDEIPQFINVIKGEMSLVGPRPAIPYEVDMYKPWHLGRLNATPGVTGLWQVTGRSSADFDEMVHLDIQYIKQQSFWLDLNIIFKTMLVVFSRKGAV
jgi:lipopolysaccharide/colanic/teichoic acid biosynthesis glycosyltransferase